ncbi:phosphoribosylamine--glycine ligase [Fulvitalea axinellae]|uniref:Phosphoribosylamine--glycine ligase n=1 Tax=Fulvitalea axinellae TaxID=1182444 RepID=A0AAU9CTG7_9BACT|nr:phosphoribosylamine--glycine ligase [Fulvitalea axinellae]
MNILILGSGGREHAFAWKISQSSLCDKLFVAPGNAGTSAVAENVAIDATDFPRLGDFVIENNVKLVVVGPEAPLVAGVRDFFEGDERYADVSVLGPDKAGAELEGSKDFAKAFMQEYGIPTGGYVTYDATQVEEGLAYLDTLTAPIVLKADGLAAGKGVIISETVEHAKETFKEMLLDGKFGDAGAKVVIEEFLRGIELSVFVLTDGKDYVILPEAKDYKRIGEGDTGLNTGGMGAVSPVPFAQGDFLAKVEERVVKPTVAGLKDRGIDFRGFLFIGLMNTDGDPFVIEYNVRMGDPETQAVLPRVESDLADLFLKAAEGRLAGTEIKISPKTATTVVMVADGYPGSYPKGDVISGLDQAENSIVFHAGTKTGENGEVLTNGGRVLAVTGLADGIPEALEKSYAGVSAIDWKGVYSRKDIGQDVMAYKS